MDNARLASQSVHNTTRFSKDLLTPEPEVILHLYPYHFLNPYITIEVEEESSNGQFILTCWHCMFAADESRYLA
jgi:hypothetical protein